MIRIERDSANRVRHWGCTNKREKIKSNESGIFNNHSFKEFPFPRIVALKNVWTTMPRTRIPETLLKFTKVFWITGLESDP
jgi:hypothetical protein